MTQSNRNCTLGLRVRRLAKLTSWFLGAMLVSGVVVALSAPPQGGHEYQLGPNDVVRIQVFGEEDLTVESKVGGDGIVNFPLLGAVPIAGKTILLHAEQGFGDTFQFIRYAQVLKRLGANVLIGCQQALVNY